MTTGRRRKRYRLKALGRILDGDKPQLTAQLRYLARHEYDGNEHELARALLTDLRMQLLDVGRDLDRARTLLVLQLGTVRATPYYDLEDLVDNLVRARLGTASAGSGQVDDPYQAVLQRDNTV